MQFFRLINELLYLECVTDRSQKLAKDLLIIRKNIKHNSFFLSFENCNINLKVQSQASG